MTGASRFSGQRVLVVEDDFFLAQDMREMLTGVGAVVVGPAPTARAALDILEDDGSVDFTVLDVNLGGERGYPVADVLMERHAPFVLTTGYDASSIPERYAAAPCCQKPVSLRDLEFALERAAPEDGTGRESE